MQFLLDTHTFLWWVAGDRQLSTKARKSIADMENDIFISSASAWEISTKYRIGKLPDVEPLVHNISAHIAGQGFKELAITVDDSQRAGLLDGDHRDPFDRMLIAQSQSRNLVLITNDPIFRQFNASVLW